MLNRLISKVPRHVLAIILRYLHYLVEGPSTLPCLSLQVHPGGEHGFLRWRVPIGEPLKVVILLKPLKHVRMGPPVEELSDGKDRSLLGHKVVGLLPSLAGHHQTGAYMEALQHHVG